MAMYLASAHKIGGGGGGGGGRDDDNVFSIKG